MGDGLMSNYDYEDDEEFTTDSNDLVKQLRKQLKAKEKEMSEFKTQFDSLSKAQRERAVKDVLEARGVNGKVAKFIPQDLDPTEESLSKWLEDNADVFGFQVEDKQTPAVDPATANAYKKMNNAVDQGLTPDSSDDIMRKLLSANSREELDEVIRNSGL
jgi:molybdopterin biosynthesis enzyme MoaB